MSVGNKIPQFNSDISAFIYATIDRIFNPRPSEEITSTSSYENPGPQTITPSNDGRNRFNLLWQPQYFYKAKIVEDPTETAGSFYCGHANFIINHNAPKSVLFDQQGDPMSLFIHVPADEFTDVPAEKALKPSIDFSNGQFVISNPLYNLDYRHAQMQQTLGIIFRGHWLQSVSQLKDNEPLRLYITGFGAFNRIVNNPSGEFVSHESNLFGMLTEAFGSGLVTRLGQNDDGSVYRYSVPDVTTEDGQRIIEIYPLNIAVNDLGLEKLQEQADAFQPHLIYSLGVNPNSDNIELETTASDKGLWTSLMGFINDPSIPETLRITNATGKRAFEKGLAWQVWDY